MSTSPTAYSTTVRPIDLAQPGDLLLKRQGALADVQEEIAIRPAANGFATYDAQGLPQTLTAAATRSALGLPSTVTTDVMAIMARGRRKVGFLGDSITIASWTLSANIKPPFAIQDSPAMWAMHASAGYFSVVQNAGVGGQTSEQIAARVQAQIIDVGCDICVIYSCCWNDAVSLAETVANVRGIIVALLAANVFPVLCGPTPDGATGNTTGRTTLARQRERSFAALAREYSIPFLPLWPVLGNPANGTMAAAYINTGDVHPNTAGNKAGGEAVAAFLKTILSTPVEGLNSINDTDDKLGGYGIFNGISSSVPTGWTAAVGLPSGCVVTLPTADATVGPFLRVTCTGTVTYWNNYRDITVVPGNTYEVTGYMSRADIVAQISILYLTGGTISLSNYSSNVTLANGRISFRFVAPVTTTTARISLYVGAGTGVVEYGNLAIRDLTAMGVA